MRRLTKILMETCGLNFHVRGWEGEGYIVIDGPLLDEMIRAAAQQEVTMGDFLDGLSSPETAKLISTIVLKGMNCTRETFVRDVAGEVVV